MKTHSKNHHSKVFSITALVILFVMSACREEDMGPSTVFFDKSTLRVPEGSEAEVVLRLDHATTLDGVLKIAVETNAVYGEHFTTDPAIETKELFLRIEKGRTSVSFKITSINNDLFDGGKFLIFRLINTSTAPHAGTIGTNTVTIADDEGPTFVDFGFIELRISENEPDGVIIDLPFSTPTKGRGSIDIALTYDNYGKRFTTDPEPTDSLIRLSILEGATGASFTILPIDNDKFEREYKVMFSIVAVGGVIQTGNVPTLEVTVHDNEFRSTASFTKDNEVLYEAKPEESIIGVSLSTPAAGAGTVSLVFSPASEYETNIAVYGLDFITIPEATDGIVKLQVTDGSNGVSVRIVPLNNSRCGNLTTILSLINGTGSIAILDAKSLVLTIIDNDISNLNFIKETGIVDEHDAAGIEVELSLSQPQQEDATIYISGPSFVGNDNLYGTIYTTNPGMEWDWYDLYAPVPVSKGTTTIRFKVYPIDNELDRPDYILQFGLVFNPNRCIVANGSYALTIRDDD